MAKRVTLTDKPAKRVELTDAPAPRFSRKKFAKALGAVEIAETPKRRGTPASFAATRWALFRQHGLAKPPAIHSSSSAQSFDDLELLLAKVVGRISTPDFTPSIEDAVVELLKKALGQTTEEDLADIRRRIMEAQRDPKHD